MSKQKISFFFEDVKHKINENKIICLIENIVKTEKKNFEYINYIFCSDKFLHKINVDSLKHDTLTDVITFNYGDTEHIEGEIYISLDRINDNAKIFNKEIDEEFLRVVIHGVLHLCGYLDKTESEETVMRQKEDFYLQK